jgi:hypothetical protein
MFLVSVGVWGIIETRGALELSERAWLAPGSPPILLTSVERNEPIRFGLQFVNSGRQPAYDVTIAIQNFTIEAYNTEFVSLPDIVVPTYRDCGGLSAVPGRAVYAPSQPGYNYLVVEDSMHAQPVFRVDEQIMNGTRFYGINACIAYNTFSKSHHTALCYILSRNRSEAVINPLRPPPPTTSPQSAAPTTSPQSAPAQPVQQGQYQYIFITCASGFNAD